MTARICPFCGAELKAGIFAGLCPKCVLKKALAGEPEDRGRSSEHRDQRLAEGDLKAEDGGQGAVGDQPNTGDMVPLGAGPSATGNPQSSVGKIRRFGDYELLEEIARGGMGVVYKARQISLNRRVALKMILAGQLAGEEEVKRFRSEAEAAANLDHPNIVSIYEVGEHEGQHYFTMQLVEGTSLAAETRQSKLRDPRSVAKLVATVARAVHYAHQRGILHRDIKPGNILMDAKGEPHVTDFGLAKRIDLPTEPSLSGHVHGTPSYMSPEQAQGRNRQLTTSTDIFSLGAVLYHLLTGQPPFNAETTWETLKRVVEEEPLPPSQVCRGDRRRGSPPPRAESRKQKKSIDRDLETICLKCLEKNPQRRYASADALADDLDRWLRREPVLARPASTWNHVVKWTKRKPAIAALIGALALVAGIGFAVSLWYARDARQKLWQAYLAQARANRLSSQPGRRFDSLQALAKAAAIRPAIELRNEAIACLALADVREQRRWRLDPPIARWGGLCFDSTMKHYVRAERDGTLRVCQVNDHREVFRLKGEGKPDWVVLRLSPDSRFLAEIHVEGNGTGLRVWDLTRRALLLARPLSGRGDLEFTPDSLQLAISDATGLVEFLNLVGGKASNSIHLRESFSSLRFSPDGKCLAAADSQRSKVLVLDLDSEEVSREFEHPSRIGSIAWSWDGEFLACACFDHRVYLWNVQTGAREAILEGHVAEATGVVFNRSGDLLVSGSWDGTTRFWDLKLRQQLIHIPGSWVPIAFGSNDSMLGFAVDDYEAGVWQVARGEECLRLAAGRLVDGASFGCHGRLLAAADEAGVALWDVAHHRLLGCLPTGKSLSALFHPSGTNLFVSGTAGLQRWPIEFDQNRGVIKAGPPETLWSSEVAYAALSQNGEILVAAKAPQPEVLVLNLTHPQKPNVLTGLTRVRTVAISGDGKWVAGGTWKGTGVAIWESQSGKLLKELPVRGNAAVALSPDRQWLATSNGEECRLWNTRSWTPYWTIPRDRAGDLPGQVVFSPDGKILALQASRISRVELIAVPAGQRLATIDEGIPLCFSGDGATLGTYIADSKLLALWDLRLIRQQLAAMQLDWPSPPLPPSTPKPSPPRLTLTVQSAASSPTLDLGKIPPRDPQTASNLIDLSAYYNATFQTNWHNLDPHPREVKNDLASLPSGVQTFAGLPFDVRGLIQVGAQMGVEFPRQVRGIRIGQLCRRLQFLHSAVHAHLLPDGTLLGRDLIHYAEVDPVTVPIVLGRDVSNWWEPSAGFGPPLAVAWRGTNSAGHVVCLFKSTWENPHPHKPVVSIDLVSERDLAAPFLVALTLE